MPKTPLVTIAHAPKKKVRFRQHAAFTLAPSTHRHLEELGGILRTNKSQVIDRAVKELIEKVWAQIEEDLRAKPVKKFVKVKRGATSTRSVYNEIEVVEFPKGV